MKTRGWPFYLTIGAIILLGTGAAVIAYRGSRGLRNNNPGNIRKDGKTDWLGMVADIEGSVDDAFVQFSKPEYGIRALARILASYARAGVVTVPAIIARYAPPSENDTEAYIHSVLQRTGWLASRRVTLTDYPALIAAITRHENNGLQPYPVALIQRGVELATV